MGGVAVALFWIFVGVSLVQAAIVAGLWRALWFWRRPLPQDAECPKACVVLCLRGTDPFLTDCVQALLSQDYPDYDVRVIVDSDDDPAWAVIHDIVSTLESDRIEIQALSKRYDTCSLKCSSLIQAVSTLDESYEVVAQLDADTIPHPSWLRELIAPLASENVGASTGNRWYMPTNGNVGSIVRYTWNAAAIAQMYWYKIAWGGTLALKTSIIREANLVDRWSHAICEDTMLYKVLRQHKQRLVFSPSLMMINRETCDLPGFFHWMKRQLLTARLYHPRWVAVAAHSLGTFFLVLFALAVLIGSAVARQWDCVAWIGGGLVVYFASMVLLLPPLEMAVRRIVRGRGEPFRWLNARKIAAFLLTIPVTQTVYPLALISAIGLRRVCWRGVEYEIGRGRDIRMVEYQPYRSAPSSNVSHSL